MAGQRVPKYYRVKERLRETIDGAAPGSALPTERALSDRFGIARATVRQALQELSAEGRVVRIQGKGTFVLPPKVTVPLQLTSHTQAMHQRSIEPTSRVLDIEQVEATDDVAAHLGTDTGTAVVRVSRLRLGDDVPMAIESVNLVAALVPQIEEYLQASSSLYQLLREHYGMVPVRATQTIETAVASPAEARLLDTDTGAPLMLLTRSSRDADDSPIEYTTSLYRGDRYRFVTALAPPET